MVKFLEERKVTMLTDFNISSLEELNLLQSHCRCLTAMDAHQPERTKRERARIKECQAQIRSLKADVVARENLLQQSIAHIGAKRRPSRCNWDACSPLARLEPSGSACFCRKTWSNFIKFVSSSSPNNRLSTRIRPNTCRQCESSSSKRTSARSERLQHAQRSNAGTAASLCGGTELEIDTRA